MTLGVKVSEIPEDNATGKRGLLEVEDVLLSIDGEGVRRDYGDGVEDEGCLQRQVVVSASGKEEDGGESGGERS